MHFEKPPTASGASVGNGCLASCRATGDTRSVLCGASLGRPRKAPTSLNTSQSPRRHSTNWGHNTDTPEPKPIKLMQGRTCIWHGARTLEVHGRNLLWMQSVWHPLRGAISGQVDPSLCYSLGSSRGNSRCLRTRSVTGRSPRRALPRQFWHAVPAADPTCGLHSTRTPSASTRERRVRA